MQKNKKHLTKNPSTATLNLFISVLTVILLIYTTFQEGSFDFGNDELFQIIYVVVGALLISMLINWKKIDTWLKRIGSHLEYV